MAGLSVRVSANAGPTTPESVAGVHSGLSGTWLAITSLEGPEQETKQATPPKKPDRSVFGRAQAQNGAATQ